MADEGATGCLAGIVEPEGIGGMDAVDSIGAEGGAT